jgi:L-threonylcarbamoyladenylate synthase
MVIYRPGAVTAAQIRDVAGPVEVFRRAGGFEQRQAMPSPGVGLRHYAPRARLVLVDAPPAQLGAQMAQAVLRFPGERVGLMLPDGIEMPIAGADLFAWGKISDPVEMARSLYAGMRSLDAKGCTVILCPLPPADGIGAAIRDRLRKAAKYLQE